MSTERRLELASQLEQQVRDAGLKQARQQLCGAGCDDCVDCGRAILAARRAALPSAVRCIGCQEQHEEAR